MNKDSASYIAGYTVKKMTAKEDMRLRGRHPEFARMSLKPGIGVDAMWDVASKLIASLDESADVPSALRSFGKQYPIGRYLKGKLREYIGRDKATPEGALEIIREEMRPLREAAFDSSSSFAQAVIDAGTPRYLQFQARNEIFKKGKLL